MMSDKKKLFIGFPVESGVAEQLLAQAKGVCRSNRACLYEIQKLHVTLNFLGWVESERVDSIAAALEVVANTHPAFSLQLKQWQVFQAHKNPTLVALTDLPLSLAALYRDMNQALLSLGFSLDKRAFRPHVTVSRSIKEPSIVEQAIGIPLTINRIILYQSVQQSNESQYLVLHARQLGQQTLTQ